MKIRRAVGGRRQRPQGPISSPTPEEIAWTRRMAVKQTKVPKGVFRYRTMEEANLDWERWHVELVAETVRERGDGS